MRITAKQPIVVENLWTLLPESQGISVHNFVLIDLAVSNKPHTNVY